MRQHEGEHALQWAVICSIAAKLGCTAETLRGWVCQAERDGSQRAGATSEERVRIEVFEREDRELHQANENLRKASRILCKRSSTAGSSHDRLHQRTPWRPSGRITLSTYRPQAAWCNAAVTEAIRSHARGELRPLRCAGGLALIAA